MIIEQISRPPFGNASDPSDDPGPGTHPYPVGRAVGPAKRSKHVKKPANTLPRGSGEAAAHGSKPRDRLAEHAKFTRWEVVVRL